MKVTYFSKNSKFYIYVYAYISIFCHIALFPCISTYELFFMSKWILLYYCQWWYFNCLKITSKLMSLLNFWISEKKVKHTWEVICIIHNNQIIFQHKLSFSKTRERQRDGGNEIFHPFKKITSSSWRPKFSHLPSSGFFQLTIMYVYWQTYFLHRFPVLSNLLL